MSTPSTENKIHKVFELSLLLKGFLASLEIIGGLIVCLVSTSYIYHVVTLLTQDELLEEPRDFVANYLLTSAQQLSVSTQHFVASYLLFHGVIKLGLIFGLQRKKLWCYPLSIVVFSGFLIYQLYRYTFSHSPWLIVLSILDLVVILLVWHEYGKLKKAEN